MLRFWHLTGLPFEVSLLVGGVAAALFGLIFGLPALRMRGLYLALTTLMIAGGFQVVISATDFPDGGAGIIGKVVNAPRVYLDRPLIAVSDPAYFRYCIVALVLGYLLVLWHKRSRAGTRMGDDPAQRSLRARGRRQHHLLQGVGVHARRLPHRHRGRPARRPAWAPSTTARSRPSSRCCSSP